jgi:hypothetical protein
VIELSNHIEKRASNRTHGSKVTTPSFVGTHNRGEVIMNRIQKTATAVMALVITLVGATLATAPLALADIRPATMHYAISSLAQSLTVSTATVSVRQG